MVRPELAAALILIQLRPKVAQHHRTTQSMWCMTMSGSVLLNHIQKVCISNQRDRIFRWVANLIELA